ncbi:MAG TPA: hypothetical protein H9699_03370 [Candidatus Gemmiger stercoravium]|nr:hypothetical protein [Candidatus Gemmiger stercoravium]
MVIVLFVASVLAHAAFGAFLAFFFILYYINGEGKWKVLFEIIIGTGGNIGIVFCLEQMIPIEDPVIKMYSIASCFSSFLVATVVILCIMSHVIKGDDKNNVIRLRDIFLGQYSFINKYYQAREKEVNELLSIPQLEAREKEISAKESKLEADEQYIKEELEKLNKLGNKKPRIQLPENTSIILNKEYIDSMPSYIADTFYCLNEINKLTETYLNRPKEEIDASELKAYFLSMATCVSINLFGGTNTDARIHFRIYDKKVNGYVKYIAVMGNKLFLQKMTTIPCDDDNMIKKSFECRRALIKSINSAHDYKSGNYKLWKDYLTYTFYGLMYEGKPYLSFGISIKNTERYKKNLQFINFFRLESFLQANVERIDAMVNIASILYGGNDNASN